MVIKHTFGLIILLAFLFSCDDQFCEFEYDIYHQSWKGRISDIYKHPSQKETFVIETEKGDQYLIHLIQGVVSWGEKGDFIFKDSLSQFAYLIKQDDGDTMVSRVFSPICDECMVNWPCDRQETIKNWQKNHPSDNKSLDWNFLKTPITVLFVLLTSLKLGSWLWEKKFKK